MTVALVLASRSPQRRAILEQLGVPFTVVVPEIEELVGGDDPVALAVENASRKALAVLRAGPVAETGDFSGQARKSHPAPATTGFAGGAAARSASSPPSLVAPSMPVLGVDTVVVVDGAVFGKPGSADEARAMLSALGGRVHEVVSGICVAEGDSVRAASATTRVRFRELDPALLDWYVATEEWRERAGGYAIQGRGAALVAGIEGDYLNVVGLPVATLVELLPGIVHTGS